MYTLLISLGLGLLISVAPLPFGVSPTWTVLPGIIISIVVFIIVSRRVAKNVEAITTGVQQEMARAQNVAQRSGGKAAEIMFRAIDNCVQRLKLGLAFKNWQFGIETMMNAQMGMLLFLRAQLLQQSGQKGSVKKAYTEAIPYLTASQVGGLKAKLMGQLWTAWAMLAVAHYRTDRGLDGAIEVLEATVKVNPKPGLLWCLYAWMLHKNKRQDDAIAVLARGVEAADTDKKLEENLKLLQNKKPMKMRAYGEPWYQLGLEQPRIAGQQARMGHPRMRGNSRRR